MINPTLKNRYSTAAKTAIAEIREDTDPSWYDIHGVSSKHKVLLTEDNAFIDCNYDCQFCINPTCYNIDY